MEVILITDQFKYEICDVDLYQLVKTMLDFSQCLTWVILADNVLNFVLSLPKLEFFLTILAIRVNFC